MYWKLFGIFTKIGAFTIGGGPAMFPIIEREIVTKRHWLDEDEFLDILSIAQSAPGVIAVNLAIFVGYRLGGVKGSIVASIGSILPSFIIILLVATVFTTFKDNETVQAVFKGIRPAVVALIATPAVRMAMRSKLNWLRAAMIIATTVLIAFAGLSPIWIIAVAIIGGAIYAIRLNKHAAENADGSKSSESSKKGGEQ